MNAVCVEDLDFAYDGRVKALDGVSLDVEIGEKVALLGPNGAGKSTLFHLLMGFLFPQRGRITIMDTPLEKKSAALVRKHLGLVFQDPDDQVFMPTVWDDIAFGPMNMGLDEAHVRASVDDAIRVAGLGGLEERAPHSLSEGEKKKVAIAGALAMNPDILLLDEPTADLDGSGRSHLMKTLDGLDKTILIATHDVDIALQLTDRAVLIDRHKIGEARYPELFRSPDLMEAAGLEMPPIPLLFTQVVDRLRLDRVPTTVQEAVRLLEQLSSDEQSERIPKRGEKEQ